jgi:hypothetical protein
VKLGVSGHQNIPQTTIWYVERELAASIVKHGASAGISSLAKGADQLFAEAILRAQLPLEAVIPCADYESTLTDLNDLAAYRRLLRMSTKVETLPYDKPSQRAYLAAGKRIVDTSDLLVAIWDGQPATGLGGTADIVAYAKTLHRPVFVIWPQGVKR